ncbi:2Fe-2S iron-sulfur cluster-binding protein [Vibrio navarrensis]|uniref:2Fe-2S ferredoxin-type domain-containing protein n=1 Tax=Vibrio navarrensis TaxID=29495 RepID=A0A099LME3_9VIBR|nr:2Fe-2S iron-sulfur cluster-binding protein [Vibrio navarrensis]EKO3572979.1 2Fe-2S iron-sulfur cluster binding domain-containing protein [Vibrio metschnikovii]KGK09330.1 hypothetical protein EA26_19225 [Vibrio navarrensis]MBE4616974.1 hypothetical protein [Vibrio navarrensis]QOD70440.1 2Fe-2S iron-sulfur cluster binding domain-containing protein [Vibrio navarrensis]
MTVELVVNNKTNMVTKGESISDKAHSIEGAEFSCLKGKCGRCLVEVINGELGHLSNSELEFLKLMGLATDGKYRLLCQGIAKSNAVVRKF